MAADLQVPTVSSLGREHTTRPNTGCSPSKNWENSCPPEDWKTEGLKRNTSCLYLSLAVLFQEHLEKYSIFHNVSLGLEGEWKELNFKVFLIRPDHSLGSTMREWLNWWSVPHSKNLPSCSIQVVRFSRSAGAVQWDNPSRSGSTIQVQYQLLGQDSEACIMHTFLSKRVPRKKWQTLCV